MQHEITQAALKAMLRYCPETGIFTWLVRSDASPQWNGRYAGKVAGSGRIYWQIGIYGRSFSAHRLAWFYMTGEWPLVLVDHHDLDGLNNSWANLRVANKSQNGANSKLSKANRSGFKGVSFCKRSRRFRATIYLGGRLKHLGLYDTAEAAHEAYRIAASVAHGEFARAA